MHPPCHVAVRILQENRGQRRAAFAFGTLGGAVSALSLLTLTPHRGDTGTMVEATPPAWKDVCEHCGRGFGDDEPRWVELRRYTVHTECAQWQLWERPPYSWKVKELRKQYRHADAESRARIVQAGNAIREAQVRWPVHAVEHVNRVLAAVRALS